MGHRVAPDRLVDLLALEHLALSLRQQLEQLELAPRQVDAAAAHERLELIRADLQLAGHQRARLDPRGGALAAPHHGLDAREHLLGVARLRDPVVGAGAQAAHPLRHARAARAHHDAHAGQRSRHALEELPRARAHEAEVDDERVHAHRHELLDRRRRLQAAVLPAEVRGPLHEHSHEPRIRVEDRDSQIRHLPGAKEAPNGAFSRSQAFHKLATAEITAYAARAEWHSRPPWSSESSRSGPAEYLALADGRPLRSRSASWTCSPRWPSAVTASSRARSSIRPCGRSTTGRPTGRWTSTSRAAPQAGRGAPRPGLHPHALRVRLPALLE